MVPTASMFRIRPRDFRTGLFKFRSTPSGSLPTDDDLLRTVTQGVRWTGMIGRADLRRQRSESSDSIHQDILTAVCERKAGKTNQCSGGSTRKHRKSWLKANDCTTEVGCTLVTESTVAAMVSSAAESQGRLGLEDLAVGPDLATTQTGI